MTSTKVRVTSAECKSVLELYSSLWICLSTLGVPCTHASQHFMYTFFYLVLCVLDSRIICTHFVYLANITWWSTFPVPIWFPCYSAYMPQHVLKYFVYVFQWVHDCQQLLYIFCLQITVNVSAHLCVIILPSKKCNSSHVKCILCTYGHMLVKQQLYSFCIPCRLSREKSTFALGILWAQEIRWSTYVVYISRKCVDLLYTHPVNVLINICCTHSQCLEQSVSSATS